MLSKIFVFSQIITIFCIFLSSIFCYSQTKQNLIVQINSNKKNNEFLANSNLKPAINLPKINEKLSKILQFNPKAAELFKELQSYYTIEIEEKNFSSTVSNLRKNSAIKNIFKASKLKINIEKTDFNIKKTEINNKNKIEQDKVITNDSHFDKQWYLNTVKARGAWEIATGKGIVIAVLDTGIDYEIEEFAGQLWINSAEDLNKNGKFDNWSNKEERNGVFGDLDGIDDDENGYIDDVIGYDFIDKSVIVFGDSQIPDSDPYDEHSHGTEVASVISAKNNNDFGITGIAYDAKIMAIRTHDATGNSECKDIANGIVYAVLNGANIINLSSGEYDNSPLMHCAIKFAFAMNCVTVASAGNNGTTVPHYPSDYDEVISVGGCDQSLERVFSFGDRLDITAPAVSIFVAAPNNNFVNNSGTSFAAPIVSAIAALLLEKDKTLTPKDIKGILQTTATPVSESWNSAFGAGIVNAKQALTNLSKAKIEISEPKHNTVINISQNDSITVYGSTATPLFQSYLLRIRKGIEQYDSLDNAKWDTVVATVGNFVLDAKLGTFDVRKYLENLQNNNDSTRIYTLSLLINLTNGNTVENRIHLNLYSELDSIKITKFEIYQPFYYEKRVPLFNIRTNFPTLVKVYYREKGSENPYNSVISNEYITDNHSFTIDEIPIEKEIEGYVTAYITTTSGNIIAKQDFVFERKSDYFDFYSFYKKNYFFPASYLYDKTLKTNDGKKKILASLFEKGTELGKIKTFELKNDENNVLNFVATDSSQVSEFAKCYGDSNGDEKIEILASYYGINNLYQVSEENSSIFSDKIFSTENYSTMFAQGMCDFDGDGKDELIFVDDSVSLFVFSFRENEYKLVIQANINDFMQNIIPAPEFLAKEYKIGLGIAIGDFDGNGKKEIALTTSQNDYLLILEITDDFQAKVQSWIELENYYFLPYNHQITAGNIDNDEKDEIIYLHYGKINDKSDALGKYEIWTYQVLKVNENKQIRKIFEDDIWGVRIVGSKNSVARNGITTGNIDGKAGEEVAICAFPNIYVLRWENSSLKPIWYFPASVSNIAVIDDFDENGKAEIGFNSFNETEFYEFDSDYETGTDIAYFQGFAISSTSLYFDWKRNNLNEKYELWLIETSELQNSNSDFTKYKTETNFIEINNLKPKTQYTAYVKLENSENYFSEPINVFTNDLTKPLFAETTDSKFVKVHFSERLALNVKSGNFKLISSDLDENSYFPVANISLISDSSLALEFSELIPNGNYKLFVATVEDYYGNPTISDTLELTVVAINKKIELYLSSLNFVSPNKILLKFSEPIENSAAENINNYNLFPYGKIESISVLEEDLVEIFLSNEFQIEGRGKDYLITANANISAKSGNKMTSGAGNTLGFSVSENDISAAYLYPNPIKLSLHTEAFIGYLTKRATVEILTFEGKLLRILEEFDGNGGIEWDLRDNNGNLCDVGVYLIKVIDKTNSDSGEQREFLTKFAIVK